MQIKNALFIIITLISFAVSAQIDSTQVTKSIFLMNEEKKMLSPQIKTNTKVKVWLKGVHMPISGQLEYVNDSTFILEGNSIAVVDIEQIKVKNIGGRMLGGILMLTGATMAGIGAFWIIESTKLAEFPGLLTALFGIGVGGVGLIATGVGFVITNANSPKYNMNEWEFQFENIVN